MQIKIVLLTTVITVTTGFAMAYAPGAMAEIYKCDGPNGPVYSDRECAPNAATIELSDSDGLSGVSDQTKDELAEKKSARDQANNLKDGGALIVNQNDALTTQDNGRWVRDRDQLKHRVDSSVPVEPKQPAPKTNSNRRK